MMDKLKKIPIALRRKLKPFINFLKKKTTIWMIGDSPMCTYDPSYWPKTGWGMLFAHFFNETIIIKNKARGGYSTKTFIEQNFWKPIASRLKKGDYVMIQFGHNDENINEPSIYTSPENYRINLLKFIHETIAKKANPILITPLARRCFDATGKLVDTHYPLSTMVRQLAKEQHIPIIDLDELSRNLLQQMGVQNSKMLFNYLLPHEHPNYPNGSEDDEHYNDFGARKIAELALADKKNNKLNWQIKLYKARNVIFHHCLNKGFIKAVLNKY